MTVIRIEICGEVALLKLSDVKWKLPEARNGALYIPVFPNHTKLVCVCEVSRAK